MPQEFFLVRSRYGDVLPTLKEACGAFFSSPEYNLGQVADDLPGAVLAAFGRYLGRLLADGQEGEAIAGFQVVNAMDGWGDDAVSTSIRDEFLEALSDRPDQAEAFARLLSLPLATCLAVT